MMSMHRTGTSAIARTPDGKFERYVMIDVKGAPHATGCTIVGHLRKIPDKMEVASHGSALRSGSIDRSISPS